MKMVRIESNGNVWYFRDLADLKSRLHEFRQCRDCGDVLNTLERCIHVCNPILKKSMEVEDEKC
jgi:hypothetical protein